jgi:hypothetical protein
LPPAARIYDAFGDIGTPFSGAGQENANLFREIGAENSKRIVCWNVGALEVGE